MANDIRQSQMGEVQLQICELVQEAINTYDLTLAIAALVGAAGSLVGTVDRDHKGSEALATWMRAFVVMYDAAYYRPQATDDA